MNARQKAKHFKKLYETTMPQKASLTDTREHTNRYHRYKVERALYLPDEYIKKYGVSKSILDDHLINRVMGELKPIIKEAMIWRKDDSLDAYVCLIDLYFKLDNGGGANERS